MPIGGIEDGHSVILTGKSDGLEPVRRSNYLVHIQDSQGNDAPEDLHYVVKSFDPPAKGVVVKQTRFANHVKNYPAERDQIEASPLVIRCMGRGDDSKNSYKFFADWFSQIYDSESDTIGLIGDATTGEIALVPCLPQNTPWSRCVLKNAWPSSIKYDGVDRDDDGAVLLFTVTFQCDDVIYETD